MKALAIADMADLVICRMDNGETIDEAVEAVASEFGGKELYAQLKGYLQGRMSVPLPCEIDSLRTQLSEAVALLAAMTGMAELELLDKDSNEWRSAILSANALLYRHDAKGGK